MSSKGQGRGRQVTMTKRRRRELIELLNDRAEGGDVSAAGWLLVLDSISHNAEVRHHVH
ncbi:hypothetical protein [Oceanisphaera pacifica]|uniref:Transcriptional regulator n=1 Tax=Oceanisphaera pacifica TaxID=2818389 RepID=A0ABS3NCH8_9GAMM|nr:hypothetical protein [Oceanisphaera pacifica]MBO1518240.1 hypothetical protein [Oceanisphaera pacifica]